MAATRGEGIPYETEDEDNVHLLKDDERLGAAKDSKTNLYEEGNQGILRMLASNYKLIITGFTVIGLIVLGVCVGAVSNKHQMRNRRMLDANFPYQQIRLPRDVLPQKYRVYLHPDLDTFDVIGRVRILVKCTTATNRIILHSTHNVLTSVKLHQGDVHDSETLAANNQNHPLLSIKIQKESKKLELLYLETPKLIPGELYTLIIDFKGKLNENLQGFYKSSYKTNSGETRYLATTHFESSAARSAFPCFDEPSMKATFKIVIVRKDGYTALSNMPLTNTTTRADGLKVDHFQESVLMSTYLVAFIVCDFAHKEAATRSGVKVRVWAPKDQIEQAQFAIGVAPKILEFYDEYFGVPFPLPKQDLVAIPDFGPGAMENWGLITYRLTSLLYDEKESSSANKQWVAVVIAHELAHQWFGNLVTMKWWNDLWLNEGFAAYVEFIGANHYDKSWKMMEQFAVDDLQGALSLDSHSNSHPISTEVENPAQINEIFDSISYDKGASIIRMLRNFIGGTSFHNGLKAYLQKHKYGNAETDDLWESLKEASDINVKSVMDTWTRQMGYPVVTIRQDKEKGKAIATQRHFLQDSKAKVDTVSPYNYKWEIPLTYTTKNGPRTTVSTIQWMHRSDDKVEFGWKTSDGWIKGNLDSIGFYRCNYDVENWKALGNQLKENHQALSAADRANLIDDAFELARAEQLDQILALELTAYLEKETDYTPWVTALSSLAYIGEVLEHRSGYQYYEAYIVKILKPMVKYLGWEDDKTHLMKYLRSSVLRQSVNHGDSDSITMAKSMFSDWMEHDRYIPPNLRSTVYLAGIKYGGVKEWEFVWEKQSKVQVAAEQRKLMFALTDTRDKKLLARYLKMTLDTKLIRSQDAASVIEAIAVNRDGRDLAWEFLKENWQTLHQRYASASFDFARLLKACAGRFVSNEKLEEVQSFFGSHDLGSGARSGKQAIENIKNHIAWLKEHEKEVVHWLKSKLA